MMSMSETTMIQESTMAELDVETVQDSLSQGQPSAESAVSLSLIHI